MIRFDRSPYSRLSSFGYGLDERSLTIGKGRIVEKSFTVGGVPMKLPIMVGAGVCKTPTSILPYMREDVSVGAVVTGSYTPERRDGNVGVLFYPDDFGILERNGFGLNSFGMPNDGKEAFETLAERQYCHPLIANVAGFSVEDYVRMATVSGFCQSVAAIEVNCGCPNAHDQKTLPMSLDFEFMEAMLEALSQLPIPIPVWLKLSPYVTDGQVAKLEMENPHLDFSSVPTVPSEFKQKMAGLISRYQQLIRAVILGNTLPNVIFRKPDGNSATTPNGGKAGLSGPIIRGVSVGIVREFVEYFTGTPIDVVGSGGILSGSDAMEYFNAGTKGIQCTSGPFWYGNGPKFFENLIIEDDRLQEYLFMNGNQGGIK